MTITSVWIGPSNTKAITGSVKAVVNVRSVLVARYKREEIDYEVHHKGCGKRNWKSRRDHQYHNVQASAKAIMSDLVAVDAAS